MGIIYYTDVCTSFILSFLLCFITTLKKNKSVSHNKQAHIHTCSIFLSELRLILKIPCDLPCSGFIFYITWLVLKHCSCWWGFFPCSGFSFLIWTSLSEEILRGCAFTRISVFLTLFTLCTLLVLRLTDWLWYPGNTVSQSVMSCQCARPSCAQTFDLLAHWAGLGASTTGVVCSTWGDKDNINEKGQYFCGLATFSK